MTYVYITLAILLIILAKGLFLSLIAIVLEFVLLPINFIAVLVKHATSRGFWNVFNNYLFQDALERDIFLHRNYRTLWNLTSSKGGTPFGRSGMTLSAMIGLKQQEHSLNGLLWMFYYILYAIDYSNWNNGGHCTASYNSYLKK